MATGPGHESQPERMRSGIQMQAGLDPYRFLGYLAENITPRMLLEDRHGQAQLSWLLERRFYRGDRRLVSSPPSGRRVEYDQEIDLGMFPNPVPVVHLRHFDPNDRWHVSTYARASFLLLEESTDPHIYFFMAGDPVEDVPDYLRPEDIVPSGHKVPVFQNQISPPGVTHGDAIASRERQIAGFVRLPFRKPLERVPIDGGTAERFNYVTGGWEMTHGLYLPDAPMAATHISDLLGTHRLEYPN